MTAEELAYFYRVNSGWLETPTGRFSLKDILGVDMRESEAIRNTFVMFLVCLIGLVVVIGLIITVIGAIVGGVALFAFGGYRRYEVVLHMAAGEVIVYQCGAIPAFFIHSKAKDTAQSLVHLIVNAIPKTEAC